MEKHSKTIAEARLAIAALAKKLGRSTLNGATVPLQSPEAITPVDTPIDRNAAFLNYAVALMLAKPSVTDEDLRFYLECFDGDIAVYLGVLEQEGWNVENHMQSLQDNLHFAQDQLIDEDYPAFSKTVVQENKTATTRIEKAEAAIRKLAPKHGFYKSADLRYLLAQKINEMAHKKREVSAETLIKRSLKLHTSTPKK